MLQWIAGALGGALISLIVGVLFQERLTDLAARLVVRRPSQGREIAGQWRTYWGVTTDPSSSQTAGTPSIVITTFMLKRLQSRVTGLDVDQAASGIIATLKDATFLTGTWYDHSGERYQWGAFQLCWDDDGKGMIGKFTGKDSQNHINHGVWLWARQAEDLLRLAEIAHQQGYQFDLALFQAGIRAAL